MTLVLFQRADGKPAGEPISLGRGRRRLSTVARRFGDPTRPHIVTVHRRQGMRTADPLAVTDMSVRLRKQWRHTSVGPRDTIIITYCPRGGGSSAGGQSGAGKAGSIGLIVATVALAAIGQFWAIGAIAGLGVSTAVASTIWAAGSAALLAGGAYLLSRATQAKANKTEDNRPVYGVAGGGNLPRSGDRIPVLYGRCWNSPDLSQPDYFVYDGDDQILYKRLTIGCGKYSVKSVRVAGVTMWTADGGITPPFAGSSIQVIAPGGTSSLVPGQVISVPAVGSNELPHASDFPSYSGPYDFGSGAPLQQRIQLDFTLPQGCYGVPDGGKFQGKQFAATWGVVFEFAPCDEDGTPTGDFTTLYYENGEVLSTRAMRFSRFVDIPSGRWTIRAQNTGPGDFAHPDGFNIIMTNAVVWEGLRAHIPQTAVRPGITELAMVIRSGKSLGVTSFGDVEVETQRILPVWFGTTTGWVDQETSKSVWAAADILRDELHGAGIPDSAIDLARLQFYSDTLDEFDEFNGVIRGPVSVYEALTTVLGTMRSSPLRLGATWTVVRDEPRAVRKHVISRRQILKDTTGQTFNLDLSDGSADVIVEWYAGGDPKRLRSQRVTFGAQTNVPRRMQATGATSAEHAIHLATWAAATAYYRRERRSLSLDLTGRLVLPNDLAMIDAWYFDAGPVAGIIDAQTDPEDGPITITLDSEITIEAGSYGVLRARDGREWGPIALTQDGASVILDPDDVAQAQTQTGLSLGDVLATRTQAMTTIVIGTLSEVQDAWLIRSGAVLRRDREPRGGVRCASGVERTSRADHRAATSAILRAGERGFGGNTVGLGQGVQRNGAMFVDWTVGRARARGVTYVVAISYDNWATSEEISRGPATSGTYPLREVDTTIYVRAWTVSANGLRSPFVSTQFSAVPAIIDLGNSVPGTLPYQAFLEGLEPVAIVEEEPDLFGYEGPKVITFIDDDGKRVMRRLSEMPPNGCR